MAARALDELGYHVHVASDGQAALDLVREQQLQLDVVLTDLVMPRLGGMGLVSQLRLLQPEVRVLYASGYVDDTARPVLGSNDDFLVKPFTTSQLASRIAALLAV
jgi:two-component system, cell cycle sensor histidine kinase and response regulator CckA